MPISPVRRALAAGLALASIAAVAPAAASAAASVSVTGDAGAPVPVPAGAPPTIRNMKPDVTAGFPAGGGRYKLDVANPQGTVAGAGLCTSKDRPFATSPGYFGNGTYTVTVTNYADDDFRCATPVSTESYAFVIAASTSITQPAGPALLRPPGSFTSNPLSLQVAGNPGANSVDVFYAKNAAVGPDGNLVGTSKKTSVDPATGLARIFPDIAGTYTAVARAVRFTGGTEVGSPFSPPIKFTVLSPFDASNSLETIDSRGPSYRVRLRLREKLTRGRVSIALARGTKGGKYRSLGSAKLSSQGSLTKRFTASRTGSYRLRFKFKGSETTAPGFIVYKFKVTRRFIG